MLKADIISHRNIDSALENSYVIFHIQDIIDLFLYMNFLWEKKKKKAMDKRIFPLHFRLETEWLHLF